MYYGIFVYKFAQFLIDSWRGNGSTSLIWEGLGENFKPTAEVKIFRGRRQGQHSSRKSLSMFKIE